MTGRLRPILNVLTPQDHAAYKLHSCGLCLAAKGQYGRRATMGHNSELIFASILMEALAERPYEQKRAGCTVLPLIPRGLLEGPAAHRAALSAGVLAALQLDLLDARQDGERRVKRFLCKGLGDKPGPIDPAVAGAQAWVHQALGRVPDDPAGHTVAGVFGEMFTLAGFGAEIAAVACRIGYRLGRLMNLSDAAEDYFKDQKAGKANALHPLSASDAGWVEETLHQTLDEVLEQLKTLPLRRNGELLETLIGVHARARVLRVMQDLRDEFERRAPSGPERAAPVLQGSGGA